MYKTELITPSSTELNVYSSPNFVAVNSGWGMGFYIQSTGAIPFDYNIGAEPAYPSP